MGFHDTVVEEDADAEGLLVLGVGAELRVISSLILMVVMVLCLPVYLPCYPSTAWEQA